MANLYTYLISSLPMLHLGMKPPFSSEHFLEVCRELIPEKDFQVLSTLLQAKEYSKKEAIRPIIQSWVEFDMALRNELVKIRASRKHLDAAKYIRYDKPEGSGLASDRPQGHGLASFGQSHSQSHGQSHGYGGSLLAPVALAAQRNPSVLDAERALDQARWKALEELAFGHYFDLDFLIIYAYKLLILQRWEKVNSADKAALLEQVLQH